MSQASNDPARFALTFAAAGERGQTAAVTALLEAHGAYIEEFTVFDDVLSGRFYLRTTFRVIDATDAGIAALRGEYAALRGRFQASEGEIHDLRRPMRVLLMVSKADHCLRDLLDQWRRGELPMDIVGVASNHTTLEPIVTAEGLPFHHLPITADTKPQQEAALRALIESSGAELVVLARYMQVLSEEMCERLAGRVINIHHSFLPGFKGARPYEQAHARGVKVIGATAHFATTDLDEGPIIEQAVERVDHAFTPDQLLSTGRHVECLALGRALHYVLQHRVFINGLRTVVLR
ncbi:formyltetrahydrofolate deformylase [Azoarcus sp. DN11]|uniref:formyltetrahydrofolate deformylase n=1 Tax=Azoarcus sp. DN11 TaxID=356837 RepID=UPI000EB074EE|nr:formyltetrahydrofolate deformylase [Azoarcus sp. DN11]AYH42402.1 formyltetrahydrofolate deformylase [Azoarcus sp. DN11]